MNIFLQYIKEKRSTLLLCLLHILVILIIFILYEMPFEAFLYILLLCFTVILISEIYKIVKFTMKHHILQKHIHLKEIYTLDMQGSNSMIEKDYQLLVNKLIHEMNLLNTSQTKNMTEMKDYYTMWAHQIKTPISALNLMFQVLEDPDNHTVNVKEMKQELFKVEFYVDAVLQYLRLEDMSSDFKFEYYSLDTIVKQSVKKFASQFIYRKIKLEIENLDMMVLTDEKWLSYVIEQLLSNAVKYTKNGGAVKIYRKETFNINDKILVIEDSGIGISDEDLPRIFERGFTGYNGRMDKKSTGIGLYLCKKAIAKLSHKISIESKLGVGTRVFIDLSSSEIVHE